MDEARHGLPKGYAIEGYRIERVLGAGGFGITYLATEIAIGRPVAIKEYLPNGIAARSRNDVSVQPLSSADDENYQWGLERFRREAQTLVNFRHPSIITVFRFFEANRTAYLVMAYEDGDSLATVLEQRRTLGEPEMRDILVPLLSGLEHVHKAGFLHRDIKPGNIYLRRDGSPVLLDFGAARLAVGARSQSLTSIVSAGYAPFEQYTTRGNQGPWSDIYSLGGVLYRAVTGQRPPDAPDRIRNDPYVPATKAAKGRYGPSFLAAIDAALLVDEEKRPQSLAEWRPIFDGAPWPPRTAGAEPRSDAPTRPPVAPEDSARPSGRDEDFTRWPVENRTGEPTAPPVIRTAPPPRQGGALKWALIAGAVVLVLAGAGTAAFVLMPSSPDPGTLADARAALREAESALGQGDIAAAERHYAEAQRLAPRLPELAALRTRIDAARSAEARIDQLLISAGAAIEQRDFAAAERALGEADTLARQHNLSAKQGEIARVRSRLELERGGPIMFGAKRGTARASFTVPGGSWPANAELRRAVDETIRKLSGAR